MEGRGSRILNDYLRSHALLVPSVSLVLKLSERRAAQVLWRTSAVKLQAAFDAVTPFRGCSKCSGQRMHRTQCKRQRYNFWHVPLLRVALCIRNARNGLSSEIQSTASSDVPSISGHSEHSEHVISGDSKRAEFLFFSRTERAHL